MRKDLKMRRGKEVAQGSHASMAFITRQLQGGNNVVYLPEPARAWLDSSFAKICAAVKSEAELLEVEAKAREAGLEVHVVTDSGATEFNGVPTKTCLCIGPDYSEKIDLVTGHLPLY